MRRISARLAQHTIPVILSEAEESGRALALNIEYRARNEPWLARETNEVNNEYRSIAFLKPRLRLRIAPNASNYSSGAGEIRLNLLDYP